MIDGPRADVQATGPIARDPRPPAAALVPFRSRGRCAVQPGDHRSWGPGPEPHIL